MLVSQCRMIRNACVPMSHDKNGCVAVSPLILLPCRFLPMYIRWLKSTNSSTLADFSPTVRFLLHAGRFHSYTGRLLSYGQISLLRWPISLLRSDFSPTLADFSSLLTFLSYAGRFLSYARPFLSYARPNPKIQIQIDNRRRSK